MCGSVFGCSVGQRTATTASASSFGTAILERAAGYVNRLQSHVLPGVDSFIIFVLYYRSLGPAAANRRLGQ